MTTPFVIPKPTMGGTVQLSATETAAWTGGQPKSDWSSLESTGPGFHHPDQLRPASSGSSQKSQAYRILGLKNVEFKVDDDLQEFIQEFWGALQERGMDTIAYLPDPSDNSKMLSVVERHSRFTLDKVKELSPKTVANFDAFDKSNDSNAKKFLYACLTPTLASDLKKRVATSDAFVVVWQRLIQKTQDTSIDRYTKLTDKIKSISIFTYPGQDVEKMSQDLQELAKPLVANGQYDHTLTKRMLTAFLEAGGDGLSAQSYRFALMQVEQKLDKNLRELGFKDDKDAFMTQQELTYLDICELVEREYLNVKNSNRWTPALNARDSKAAPAQFGAHLATSAPCGDVNQPLTQQLLALLLQQNTSNDKSPKSGKCHNCGEAGHWSRECPKPRNDNRSGRPGGRGGGRFNKGGRGRGDGDRFPRGRSWKTVAPGDGQPTTKQHNGKSFRWCAKCGRWSTTHDTTSHKNKTSNDDATAPTANLSRTNAWLIPDPAAWNLEFNVSDTPPFYWLILAGLLPFGCIVSYLLSAWLFNTMAAPICQLVGSAFMFIGPLLPSFPIDTLWLFLIEHWTVLLAPLSWLVPFLWLGLHQPHPPDPELEPRTERRANARAAKSYEKFHTQRLNSHSLRAAGLHRSYNRRHRSRGLYVGAAPTHETHQRHAKRETIRFNTVRHSRNVERARHPGSPVTSRVAQQSVGREGELQQRPIRREAKMVHCGSPELWRSQPNYPRRRARRQKRSSGRYQPTVCDMKQGSPQGNSQFTDRQVHALQKIINHTMMKSTPCFANVATLRMALQAPVKFRNSIPKASSFQVLWDSGASISVSHDKRDFVGPFKTVGWTVKLQGIAKGLNIEGQGHVAWSFMDTSGQLRTFKLPAYYVPRCRVRLLSTTSLLQTYTGETIVYEPHKMTLSGLPSGKVPMRGPVEAHVSPINNIPTATAYTHQDVPKAVTALNGVINTVSAGNFNLSEPQKELLRWHYRLGHFGMRKVQLLMRTGVLAHSEKQRRLHTACSKIEHPPTCAACQFGKQRQRPSPGKKSSVVRDRSGAIKQEHLHPGQQVSCDHFVCSTKGRLFGSRGKTADKDMFCGGAIFVDHSSGYVHIQFQKHLNSHETLEAKTSFELMCRDHGVIVQSYLSDNGSCFTSKDFSQHLSLFQQIIRFAGAGAHHHNGCAERAIQTIMSIARTMMLHAAIHWPDVADPQLWPMAVQHAAFLYKHIPQERTGLAPVDVFTKSRWEQNKLHDLYVWGCPAYILNKTITDGKKLPRWTPRSQRQVYMGTSANHASTVPLVLNPDTGAITAQFHCVMDNWFATVATSVDELPNFESPEWRRLFGDSEFQYPVDETGYSTVEDDWQAIDPADLFVNEDRKDRLVAANNLHRPAIPLPVPPPPQSQPENRAPAHGPVNPSVEREPSARIERESAPPPPTLTPPPPIVAPLRTSPVQREIASATESPAVRRSNRRVEIASDSNTAPVAPRRSPRLATSPTSPPPASPIARTYPKRGNRGWSKPRLGYDGGDSSGYTAAASTSLYDYGSFEPFAGSAFLCDNEVVDPFVRHCYNFDINVPLAFKAAVSDPDTLNWDEAMAINAERDGWLKAAAAEISALELKGTWTEVDSSEARTRILPGMWVMRRKRTPDGIIKKLKARYTVRGDLQETDEETYSPVVAWSTIRVLLVVSLMLGWKTCSIDFANAFVQAKLDNPVWIHLPRGFGSSDSNGNKRCLRLEKSLYGLSIAPRQWMLHIRKALIDDLHFVPSDFDECLFYRDGVMIGLYVDDCVCCFREQSLIDDVISELRAHGFELTVEGTLEEFLGIKLVRNKDASFTLTQTGLIKKVLAAAGMEDCNPNAIPAVKQTLGADPDGAPMNETWSYSSITGMLIYLATNTRLDIALAVSQVARFNHNPKQSHATAVKMILRYLKGTQDKGMIIHPSSSLDLDLYVDGDYAGLYKSDPDSSPTSAKSRMGYVIRLANCPLIWKSQLLQEVALSVCEVEYSALSHSIRALIPIQRLLVELVKQLRLEHCANLSPIVRSRVFEDNAAALQLATTHRMTNRTRYFHTKWHWFWALYRSGLFTIEKVDTKYQLADGLTKPNVRETFERLRELLQGW